MTVEVELSTFHPTDAEAMTPSLISNSDVKIRGDIDGGFTGIEQFSPQDSKTFHHMDVEQGQALPTVLEVDSIRDEALHFAHGAQEINERRLRDARRREEMRRDEHEAFKRQI